MLDPSRYFAALPEGENGPKELLENVAARVQECAQDFTWDDAATAYEHLYGESPRFGSQSEIRRTGEKLELVKLRANKAKANLKSWVSLMLGPPLSWRPSARNDDVECRSAAKSTADLMEHFDKERGLKVFVGEWGEAGCAFDTAYALVSWDATRGQEVGAGESVTLWSGGLVVDLVQKWDAFYDKQYRSRGRLPWLCLRTYESRHDLAALEPDETRKQAILDASDMWMKAGIQGLVSARRKHGNDVVPVFNFFHKPTPAVPNGLKLRFLSADVQLGDAEPCKRIPAIAFSPAVKQDSTEGDTQFSGTLGLQQMFDSVNSAVATNLDGLAIASVEMPADMAISVDSVTGAKVFERPKGMPPGQVEALELYKPIPGVEDVLSMWSDTMERLLGLNAVSQGNPDTAQMNAAAFAILKSAATEINSQPQRRLLDAYGQLGTLILETLSENMTEEDFIAIAGRDAKAKYPPRKVGKTQLGLVESVYIEVGNALEQTIAGRMQMTDYALKAGALKDPRAIFDVMRTGRYPDELDRAVEEKNLVEWENDQILSGVTPTVFYTHDHLVHCAAHSCVGSNPMALQDENALKALKAHIDWHYAQFYNVPPGASPEQDPQYADRLRVLLGQPAPSQVGPPPGPPVGGGPPSAPGESQSSPPNGPPPALSPAPQESAAPTPEAPPPVVPQPPANA